MTEDEAKTRWCPFAREPVDVFQGAPTGNRDILRAKVFHESKCVASRCMAWRRQTVMIDRRTNEPAIPGCPTESMEERYSAHGYCGLAGQP